MSSSQPPGPSSEPERGEHDTWTRRFDAPLTVTPRPVQRRSVPRSVLTVVAAVIAVAVVGGLAYWLTRPSSEPEPTAAPPAPTSTTSPPAQPSPSPATPTPTSRADDEARLMQMLPPGYPPGSCEPVDAAENTLAQINCGRSSDPDGPLSAVYTLVADREALDAAFTAAMQAANQVVCPGNIQSPGPWRRNATPDKVSGTLFCGLREGQPTVIWTDEDRLLVSGVESGPDGPTFPQLYSWWSSHS